MPNNIKNSIRGITLAEVLIVIALISIVASFGLFVSMDTYSHSSFWNERDTVVSALMHARAQAMNGTCMETPSAPCKNGKAHGVHISTTDGRAAGYVIFQGDRYTQDDPTNEEIGTNHPLRATGASDIIFQALSGDTEAASLSLVGEEGETSDIDINTEGRISWTH